MRIGKFHDADLIRYWIFWTDIRFIHPLWYLKRFELKAFRNKSQLTVNAGYIPVYMRRDENTSYFMNFYLHFIDANFQRRAQVFFLIPDNIGMFINKYLVAK